MMIVDNCVS